MDETLRNEYDPYALYKEIESLKEKNQNVVEPMSNRLPKWTIAVVIFIALLTYWAISKKYITAWGVVGYLLVLFIILAFVFKMYKPTQGKQHYGAERCREALYTHMLFLRNKTDQLNSADKFSIELDEKLMKMYTQDQTSLLYWMFIVKIKRVTQLVQYYIAYVNCFDLKVENLAYHGRDKPDLNKIEPYKIVEHPDYVELKKAIAMGKTENN